MADFSNSLLFSSKTAFLQISADFIRKKNKFQDQLDVFFFVTYCTWTALRLDTALDIKMGIFAIEKGELFIGKYMTFLKITFCNYLSLIFRQVLSSLVRRRTIKLMSFLIKKRPLILSNFLRFLAFFSRETLI